jgi:hypothetical protein
MSGCAATFVAGLAFSTAAAAEPSFHAPGSGPELALARILKLDESPSATINPSVEGPAGHRPPTKPPPGAPYLKRLTTPLATAILVAEARAVKESCGGVYKKGELCGLDADPIICGQDFPDHYLFRTTQATPTAVSVEAAWPPDAGKPPERSGAYRLKLVGGAWKIDAIACAAGDRYNWGAP